MNLKALRDLLNFMNNGGHDYRLLENICTKLIEEEYQYVSPRMLAKEVSTAKKGSE